MFYFSLWTKNTNNFRNLLNTSKGRDKFCQLLQYSANFYITCMRESAEYGKLVKEKKISSVNKAKKLESSISNGRKIFRLFLFLNESAELYELIKQSKFPLPLRVLKIVSTCCSFIYYFTDNIVYLSNMGFVEAFVPHTRMKWKQIKNIFSFTKTILEIIISIYTIYEKKKEEL